MCLLVCLLSDSCQESSLLHLCLRLDTMAGISDLSLGSKSPFQPCMFQLDAPLTPHLEALEGLGGISVTVEKR